MEEQKKIRISLFERLTFESQILHLELKKIINSKKEQLCELQNNLKHIQKQFYIITSHLYE